MKRESYAEMTARAYAQYVLSDEKLKKLHDALLIMMDDIDAVCRANGVKYMLSGGSCLGAVRHKGFIPWDDDVDIMMYYDDMLLLKRLIEQEFPGKYEVVVPLSGIGAGRMMKIHLCGTEYVEIGKDAYPTSRGVFVDVFPIISMPPKRKHASIAKKHKLATRMYSYGLMSKYPSVVAKKAATVDKMLKRYYNRRRTIGFLARVIGLGFWRKQIVKYETAYLGETDSEGIPSGIDYQREVFEKGFFENVIDAQFEGRMYYIPLHYEDYLKNLYNDYMRVPPPEKRERHYASKMNFGKYAKD